MEEVYRWGILGAFSSGLMDMIEAMFSQSRCFPRTSKYWILGLEAWVEGFLALFAIQV